MALELAKCFASPGSTPTFIKKRRGTSRAVGVADFKRDVETDAEKSLFHSCHDKFSRGSRTDWTGMVMDYNLRVMRAWRESGSLSDLYLKDEGQLKRYEKQFVREGNQTWQHEIRTAMEGVQAGVPATETLKRARLEAPTTSQQPSQARGVGRGGAGAAKQCIKCSNISGATIWRKNHNCALYILSRGLNPEQHSHAATTLSALHEEIANPNNRRQRLPTQQEAEQECAKMQLRS